MSDSSDSEEERGVDSGQTDEINTLYLEKCAKNFHVEF